MKKYVLYAIGEIMLVVIGILVALQIDDWNEQRKAEAEMKKTFENLHREFSENREALLIVQQRLEVVIAAQIKLLNPKTNKLTKMSDKQFSKMLWQALTFPTWNPSSFVLSSLKNSDKLEIIENDSIKIMFYDYEGHFQRIQEGNEAMEASALSLLTFIKLNGSMRNIGYYGEFPFAKEADHTFDNRNLLNRRQFTNYIAEGLAFSTTLQGHLNKMLPKIDKILLETKK